MARSNTPELTPFRRTFALLILLVVLPSAGLSGFGVVAIINERAAVEKRLEAAWSGRLQVAQVRLREELDEMAQAPRDSEGLTDLEFTFHNGEIESSDPRFRAAIATVSGELSTLPEASVVFSVASPQGTFLVLARREGEVVRGARLKPVVTQRLVDQAGKNLVPPGELAHFEVRALKRDTETPGTLVGRLVSGVTEAKEAALGPRELASLALQAPLQDYRLVAVADGEDPVAQASTRNRAVYGVLLGVFYLTLALGVVYTARTLYREARLSRMKTDFVSLVSHELRTPLTSIRMFIDMLAMGRVKDQAETQRVLEMLSKETERLSSMIERVLDWARIEGGRKQYDLHPTQVKEIVDGAVQAFQTSRVGAPMKLEVTVEPGLPVLKVDREALAGALLNLLQNAFKYTGEDKQILLTARRGPKAVELAVRDNGMGIPRRERKKIFERFYRVDNLLTRTTEGSGLGLSIAQRIVQAHGGQIEVDSEPGKGSTFVMRLPV